jgi:hypothetical protein
MTIRVRRRSIIDTALTFGNDRSAARSARLILFGAARERW